MDDGDLRVRNLTYQLFADRNRPPSCADVAIAAKTTIAATRASWRRLHDARAIVLDGHTGELRMAHPFSAVPTRFQVHTAGRRWFANCAWDAFGLCAALHSDGPIDTSCAECAEPIGCSVEGERVADDGTVFHCLVPAAGWWDDIVHT